MNVPIVLRLIRCRCRVSHSISHDIDDLHHSQPSRRNGINTSPLLRAIAAPVASSNSNSPFIVAIVVVSRGQTGISTMIPQESFFVVHNLFPAGKLQDYDLSTCATVLLSNQSVLSCVSDTANTLDSNSYPRSIENFYHVCPLSQLGCAGVRILLCLYTVVVPYMSP